MKESKTNLELLAKVLKVFSVGNVTQVGSTVRVTYRQNEEDNTSWYQINVHDLAHEYKLWAIELGYEVNSGLINVHKGYAEISKDDMTLFAPFGDSEPRAVKIACEFVYERYEK